MFLIRQIFSKSIRTSVWPLLLITFAFCGSSVQAQFTSGSNGVDGAFNPASNVTITLPPNGVFNYTTVNIPPGVQVRYTRNALNTPVTLLAQGNVTISGQIILSGTEGNGRLGGPPGPGGFRGGNGGSYLDSPYGTPGDGPGGGSGGSSIPLSGIGGGGGGGYFQSGSNGGSVNGGTGGQGGLRYGTRTLLPLIGGSGGGGSGVNANSQNVELGGGGGGGAIVIASSTSITFAPGAQFFQEGVDARGAGHNSGDNSSGGGSGGAIRLVANTISGSPCLNVAGGSGFGVGGNGASGIVRVEGFNLSGLNPQCSTSSITLGQPNPVTLANTPTLRIASVGGLAPPANPVGLINAPPDIVVPTSVPNPVSVVVNGTNLPSGTVIQVKLTPETGDPTSVSGTLTGSTASSTATVNLTLPNGGVSVIRATVTLDVLLALGRPTFIDGEKVDKVEVAATFGGQPEIVYIMRNGRRVTTADLQR